MDRTTDDQRTLRLLAAGPFLALVLCIGASAWRSGAFETSISAYYSGPVRDVFVGSLLAAALAFVAYRGTNDLEDLALDAAGFFAPFVALVPWDYGYPQAVGRSPLADDLRVNVGAYLVVAAALAAAQAGQVRQAWGRLWGSSRATRVLMVTAVGGVAWQTGLTLVRLADPGAGFAWVHPSAALLMVASMGLAIASQLVSPRHRGARWDAVGTLFGPLRRAYGALLVGMALGGPAVYLVLRELGWPDYFFWSEAWEFAAFVLYWLGELVRHGRGRTAEPDPSPVTEGQAWQ